MGVLRFKFKYVWPRLMVISLSTSHYARKQKTLEYQVKPCRFIAHLTYTFSEKIRARAHPMVKQHLKAGLLTENLPTENLPTDSILLLTKQTYSKQTYLRKLLSQVSCKGNQFYIKGLKHLVMHTVV